MSDETIVSNRGQMIDTTDCLEAVSVFRAWKNFFFLIVLICLLIVQIAFWLVDTKMVPVPAERVNPPEAQSLVAPATPAPPATPAAPPTDANSAANKPVQVTAYGPAFLAWLTFERLERIVEMANGVLIIAACLFCLSMFFSLMVSLIGRLGGINHIARAFFLSLIMAVLVLPWQKMLGLSIPGVVYTPNELITWMADKNASTLNTVVYYLRFFGYWLVVLLLLLTAQLRSARWTKSILRRLEII
jgi:vacuolar-type H+-ATPase subunit I/STV1